MSSWSRPPRVRGAILSGLREQVRDWLCYGPPVSGLPSAASDAERRAQQCGRLPAPGLHAPRHERPSSQLKLAWRPCPDHGRGSPRSWNATTPRSTWATMHDAGSHAKSSHLRTPRSARARTRRLPPGVRPDPVGHVGGSEVRVDGGTTSKPALGRYRAIADDSCVPLPSGMRPTLVRRPSTQPRTATSSAPASVFACHGFLVHRPVRGRRWIHAGS